MGKADQGYQSRVAIAKIAERKERVQAYYAAQADVDANIAAEANAHAQI